MQDSKFNTKAARVIAAQLYVAKGLKRNPSKMIKFMKTNRDYFPDITDKMLLDYQKEHNISDEDIEKAAHIELADLKAEDQFYNDLLNKANKFEEARKKNNT